MPGGAGLGGGKRKQIHKMAEEKAVSCKLMDKVGPFLWDG